MTAIPSQEISHRTDFSILCNARGLTHNAAEVGTDRGVFASDFLSRWEGRELFCVDPYEPYPEMPRSRDCDQMMAVLALQKFFPRVRMFQMSSIDAVAQFPHYELPLDFIYIDAAHDYESVLADLRAWYPLLSSRGIFAGHDYDNTHPGVIQAVNAFSDEAGRQVYLTGDQQSSWYFYATEPEMLIRRYFTRGVIANPNFQD